MPIGALIHWCARETRSIKQFVAGIDEIRQISRHRMSGRAVAQGEDDPSDVAQRQTGL